MSAKVNALSKASERLAAEQAPPEVLFEVLVALGIIMRAEGMQTMAVDTHAILTMRLFGGHGADEAWARERQAMPWFKRIWHGGTPREFRQKWSDDQRALGLRIVDQIMEEHP